MVDWEEAGEKVWNWLRDWLWVIAASAGILLPIIFFLLWAIQYGHIGG